LKQRIKQHMDLDYTRIKQQLAEGLMVLQTKGALVITVEDGVCIGLRVLRNRILTPEQIAAAICGDAVVFVHTESRIFTAKEIARFDSIRLAAFGHKILDYVLVSPNHVAYGTKVGIC